MLKAYLCAGQPQPDPTLLEFEAGAWEEALTAAGVPDDALNDVYRKAIGRHDTPYRLSTGELIAAWGIVARERLIAANTTAVQARHEEAKRLEAERQANVLSLQERIARIG